MSCAWLFCVSGMSQTEAKTEINRIISLIAGIMLLFMLLFTGTTIAVVKSMAKGLIRGTGALEQVAAGKGSRGYLHSNIPFSRNRPSVRKVLVHSAAGNLLPAIA